MTKEQKCPYCDHLLNSGIDLLHDNDDVDYSNSVGLCYYCANVVVFVNNEPSQFTEEISKLMQEVNPALYRDLLVAQKELQDANAKG